MHVTLVGLGNIGSHAAPVVARIPELTHLTLIDHDRYEKRNLANQAVRQSDAGKSKVSVQARNLRTARPDLSVETICDSVERVPLGRLKCDLLLAAVDTRITRQYLNEACWMLGMPWIDSGVHADGGLVRISTFAPGAQAACLECDWDDRHYATLETSYQCGAEQAAARTGASAGLGALAGSLLAIECSRWLKGTPDPQAAGRELIFDTQGYKHRMVEMRRNQRCRFSHSTIPQAGTALANDAPISKVFEAAGPGAALSVACAGAFAKRAACQTCGGTRRFWTLAKRLMCRRCGTAVPVPGFDLVPQFHERDLTATLLARPLTRFGIQDGDILVLQDDQGQRSIQIGASHA